MTASAAPWQASTARTIYLSHFRPRFSEIDPLGHVNNAVYLTWLEQSAIDHATALGYGLETLAAIGGVFIAHRHEIDYLAPARAGDLLRVTTWPVALTGARAIRQYEISRLTVDEDGPGSGEDRLADTAETRAPAGDLLLRARTEWVYVDTATHHPKRMPAEMAGVFLAS